jgi:hypothetical protein
MSSEFVRPELSTKTYNEVMIVSGVKVTLGLETALKQILKELKSKRGRS